jgi:GYF domain 2
MVALDAPNKDAWFVAAEGKAYGPYTEEQLKAFVGEGRVTAATPVMRGGERWSLASEHASLAWIFSPRPTVAPPMPAAAAAPAQTLPHPAHAEPVAAGPVEASATLAKVMLIAELRTGSTIAFENAISKLGQSYRMNQLVWLVHTGLSIAQIRKELVPFAGRNDPIFIADTTNGRAAWINFGPGAEATIKALWRGAS